MKKTLLCLALFCATQSALSAEITVSAAASLSDALTEAGKSFEAQSGDTVHFSFAASSVLAKQIEAGAPAALFFSADEDWMNYVEKRGLLADGTRKDLLRNKLVLIEAASKHDDIQIQPGFPLAQLLGTGKLAMGEPGSVPAGKYGKEALVALGVWDAVSGKVAAADSVRSAMAFVQNDETPFGIVYATDAASTRQVRIAGTFPEYSHKPITYPVAILKDADSAAARAFLNFVEGPQGHDIFARYGFSSP